jgi:hypothetical protein
MSLSKRLCTGSFIVTAEPGMPARARERGAAGNRNRFGHYTSRCTNEWWGRRRPASQISSGDHQLDFFETQDNLQAEVRQVCGTCKPGIE